ncbi:MAG: hydroxyacid dehydrogenase [Candidatus Latescibacteria bacterium]|nr:hydroxyacid dehydrogenase [Candidatus Latescibacterota bacterium]MBT5829674.1 hydroxyacid dehydrogenase [Candidatus Latescibacterota bacterium]
MEKPKIYVALPEKDSNLRAEDRDHLRTFADVIQHPGDKTPTDDEKRDACEHVHAMVIGRTGGWLTREIIDAAGALKAVGVVGGAVGRTQPEYLLDKGVTLINTGWAMSPAVAETTLAMMLNGLRDFPHMIARMKESGWGKARDALDLTGKSVGLIGFGMIAKRVAELLQPFHVDLRVFDPYIDASVVAEYGGQLVSLNELMAHSLIVSVHAGLTDETTSMIGARELAMLPDRALLVNTARAGVVDENALVTALVSGRIRAALNVFWKEPLQADHPLRDLDNVILTPHGGGLTLDTMRRHSESVVQDLELFFKGEPVQNVITREMLGRMT